MRRGIAALGVFAAVTALAACNNGTTSSSSSSSSDGAKTDAVATLTIWADDTRFTQVETIAEDFTAKTGVKVDVVQKSESDMDTEFTTQVPTGNGPDLIVMATTSWARSSLTASSPPSTWVKPSPSSLTSRSRA